MIYLTGCGRKICENCKTSTHASAAPFLTANLIASELSRLGRSIKETLNIIETIIEKKQSRFVLIKQNLDINPNDRNKIINKVLITVFSMLAGLELDFISERTKEGLKARAEKG